jgi:aquaporin Z
MDKTLFKKGLAEMLGTFVLVLAACGTAAVTYADPVATSLAFGLSIVAMAYSVGGISGCHINPAVSLGMLLMKKMKPKEFGVYVAAQFAGAIVGATFLYSILKLANFSMSVWAANGVPKTDPVAGGYIAAVLVEIVLTFIFVFTVISVTSKREYAKKAGLIIGLTLTLVHLLGIRITGTSVNPARSFGTALMSFAFGASADALKQIWVFLLAPLAGGALAALCYNCFHTGETLPLHVAKEDKKTAESAQEQDEPEETNGR